MMMMMIWWWYDDDNKELYDNDDEYFGLHPQILQSEYIWNNTEDLCHHNHYHHNGHHRHHRHHKISYNRSMSGITLRGSPTKEAKSNINISTIIIIIIIIIVIILIIITIININTNRKIPIGILFQSFVGICWGLECHHGCCYFDQACFIEPYFCKMDTRGNYVDFFKIIWFSPCWCWCPILTLFLDVDPGVNKNLWGQTVWETFTSDRQFQFFYLWNGID